MIITYQFTSTCPKRAAAESAAGPTFWATQPPAISDNVFVATVYINEVVAALNNGEITREHFNKLAVAITGHVTDPPEP